ncbi:Polysaccharide deacetylase [Actinopolyspora xinjiangensis]|uniref:Polysaccharide deacetylase n=1 Tax=Actinopolyspora xinjiangensis TaxID=405564 RepID=A0A1H0WV42_9ACTN|nr:polysaccharide deacetylase family protein [Actinopolyspora xinjiangensis]SDP94460.1 Polysaccharide deacetylase [Actinopolyspora xinjiangensis]
MIGSELAGVDQRLPGGAPPVLMYHSVQDYVSDPYRVTVRPERFARQLRWLRLRGWTGVGMGELLRAHRRGRARGLVGLTFDDGYADFDDTVVATLREHGFTATVFVLAHRLGGYNAWDGDGPRKSLMNAEQVRRVARQGMEIGSHGLLHRPLSELPHTEMVDEVHRSRAELTELLGVAVEGFCYPYGDLDRRTMREVDQAGYSYACAVRPASLACGLAIPRIHVGDRDNELRLEAKRWRARLRPVQ